MWIETIYFQLYTSLFTSNFTLSWVTQSPFIVHSCYKLFFFFLYPPFIVQDSNIIKTLRFLHFLSASFFDFGFVHFVHYLKKHKNCLHASSIQRSFDFDEIQNLQKTLTMIIISTLPWAAKLFLLRAPSMWWYIMNVIAKL